MTPASPQNPADVHRAGLVAALTAFGIWGFFPLYFRPLTDIGADIVICHRIIWSVFFIGLYLLATGKLGEIIEICQKGRQVASLALSGSLILINWFLFIWAVEVERVLDISFGYFINPLVSIMLGLVLFKERLNNWQAAAVLLAAIAVATKGLAMGGIPWLGLILAFSFAGYGYLRKINPVKAVPGLFIEAALLLPLAIGYLSWRGSKGATLFPLITDPLIAMILAGSGIVTAFALVQFARGARRLPLSTIGILQYITPSLQFSVAVFAFAEPLEWGGLVAFIVIWISLAIYTVDLVRTAQKKQSKGPHLA